MSLLSSKSRATVTSGSILSVTKTLISKRINFKIHAQYIAMCHTLSYNTVALWIQVDVGQVQHSSQGGFIGSIEARVVKVEEAGSRRLPVSSPAARPPERSPGRSSRGWWSGCGAASSLASSSKL